jgi:hypothetical protein
MEARPVLSEEPTTRNLSRFTGLARVAGPVSHPSALNHWVIPTFVVVALVLAGALAVDLAGSGHRPVRLLDVVLTCATFTAVNITVVFLKILAVHRAQAIDHELQAQRSQDQTSQLVELRTRTIIGLGEVREAAAASSVARDHDAQQRAWQAYSEGARDVLEGTSGESIGKVHQLPRHRSQKP